MTYVNFAFTSDEKNFVVRIKENTNPLFIRKSIEDFENVIGAFGKNVKKVASWTGDDYNAYYRKYENLNKLPSLISSVEAEVCLKLKEKESVVGLFKGDLIVSDIYGVDIMPSV